MGLQRGYDGCRKYFAAQKKDTLDPIPKANLTRVLFSGVLGNSEDPLSG